MPNRLIHETSPYLLQHAHNPVDWYPWGPEALERARGEDKPILLSIGYSACHWCHVMERESFEDAETAGLMNEHFVCVKVDREERPDLDSVYMSAVQAMTGHGGWPMTMFLTPDGGPFFGGTYFPPDDRPGIPAFRRILLAVAEAYDERKDDVQRSAQALREALQRASTSVLSPGILRSEVLDRALRGITSQYDTAHGGFGGAPKFPQPMVLEFLLRSYRRTGDPHALAMAEDTLTAMAYGGMYDQVGGGFHRYSVDGAWQIPHFEKMLYDNAQLARVYLHAWQATGNPFFRRIATEVLDYVLREMRDPAGGFYSTEDADSEGDEGKFYVWSIDELKEVLDAEGYRAAMRYCGVLPEGNFEGRNVLHVEEPLESVAEKLVLTVPEAEAVLARARVQLREARSRRVRPGRDDKIITSWNGLMLQAFAEAGAALERQDYVDAACANARFVLDSLRHEGRLVHTYRAGHAGSSGFLEDYVFYAAALLSLYEATFDLRWFRAGRELMDTALAEFWDQEQGGFFDTGKGHEELVARPREFNDGATPSGNSVAADTLLRLAALTGRQEYRERATILLRLVADAMGEHPLAFSCMLGGLDRYLAPSQEIAVVGPPASPATQDLLRVVRSRYLPNAITALKEPQDEDAEIHIPLLEDRLQVDGRPTAYVCENFACRLPVTSPEELAQQLDSPGPPVTVVQL